MQHIEIKNINKIYQIGGKDLYALKNISFDVQKGDFISLCGPSGSGKSTLLSLIGCMDQPTSGSIKIENHLIKDLNDKQLSSFRAHHLGFIFQSFNLLPVLSAFENIEYPLIKVNMSNSDRKKNVLEALKKVGLIDYAHHLPNQLSGGQKQRVAIARAIVHHPHLLVADEPTANLDTFNAIEILKLLSFLNETMNLTIIIATHDLRVMEKTKRKIQITDGVIA